jgi:23S rRNA pseudouridine1911/1915/1917 synthase
MKPGASLVFVVGEEEAGERVDVVLAGLAQVSRAQAKRWVEAGRVEVDDAAIARASRKLALGEVLGAEPPEPVAAEARPEPIPLCVVFEDEDVVVVDKPAGLVVHPAPGHPRGTLVNALLHHCSSLAGIGGVLRPGIVHRLDRGTSGILVAAKNDAAHQALSEQFRDHSIDRLYRAIVRGLPGADEGRVDAPIGRHPRDRKRMSTATRSGREAHTAWRIAERFAKSDRALVEVRPETGRTHQIRVHLASSGMPIVGDSVYGRGGGNARERALGRPALHAAALGFTHPRSGERLRFEVALPDDLAELLAHYREREAMP